MENDVEDQANDTRSFPIQAGKPHRDNTGGAVIYPKGSAIPWWLAEVAYEHYKTIAGGTWLQSLERLAERGGFGRKELVLCYEERSFSREHSRPSSGWPGGNDGNNRY